MTRPRGMTALSGLVTCLTVLSCGTLVESNSWFGLAVIFVVVVGVVGALARRVTARGGLIVLAQLAAVVLVATWQYAGSASWFGLPSLGVVRRFATLFTEFGQTVYGYAAPLPLTPAVGAVLVLSTAATAILVDYLAVTRSAPAAAGLPLLTVFLTATANSGAALPLPYFLLAAGSWLILLARHAQLGMARWASAVARPLVPVAEPSAAASAATRFGSVARRLGIVGLVVAAILPAVLPHLPTRYILDGLARSSDARGGGTGRVGYASTLDVTRSLSAGRSEVLFRYRTTATTPAPLRVLATSGFDGTTWTPPDPSLGRTAQLDLSPSVGRVERSISVENYRLDPPALATPQPLTAADFNGVAWQVDQATSDVYVQTRPDSYSTSYLEPTLTATMLRDGVDGSPGPDPLPTSRTIAAALRVDPQSAALVQSLLPQIVGSAQTPFDRAAAIQDWLRVGGGFTYTLTLPQTPTIDGRALDPISAFLTTRAGYCVQFASAMVMLARAAGIPARMAIGFLPGTFQDGLYTVSTNDAHSWPELFFPGAGWVRFEPTPGSRTGAAPAWTQIPVTPAPTATSGPRPTGAVDTPDRSTRLPTDTAGEQTEIRQPLLDRLGAWLSDPGHLVLLAVLLGLAAALVLPVTAYLIRRLRQRRGGPPAAVVEAQWSEFTGKLADLGIPPPPGGTLRDCQRHYSRAGYLDAADSQTLGRVVTVVETARYARPGTDLDTELGMPLARLVHTVARTRSWRQRLRAELVPGDARAWWGRLGSGLVGRLAAGPGRWRAARPRLRRGRNGRADES